MQAEKSRGPAMPRADQKALGIELVHLASQAEVRARGNNWHGAVYAEVEARLGGDLGFPCLFARGAFRKEILLFSFVESFSNAQIYQLGCALKEYTEISSRWFGSLNNAYPLIIAFSLDVVAERSVEGYHAFGWQVLQKLHEIDPAPWPPHVARDVNDSSWSMSFNGMPIFCNMSHPAHKRRRSRNLGQHFMLVINPRERFDVVAGDNPTGRKIRAQIRQRIAQFDQMEHSSELGSYGTDSLEWKQYALDDGDPGAAISCPFRTLT